MRKTIWACASAVAALDGALGLQNRRYDACPKIDRLQRLVCAVAPPDYDVAVEDSIGLRVDPAEGIESVAPLRGWLASEVYARPQLAGEGPDE